jgi:hypothetical protein
LAKTIAKKEKISVSKVIKKYGINVPRKKDGGMRNIIGVKYLKKSGEERTITYFNESLERRRIPQNNVKDSMLSKRHEILDRLNNCKCELCGYSSSSHRDYVIHHVRKLKSTLEKYKKPDTTPPLWVNIMGELYRKTLVVCKKCHQEIHN